MDVEAKNLVITTQLFEEKKNQSCISSDQVTKYFLPIMF